MFGAVLGLSLFSKTIKPRNCKSDSAASLRSSDPNCLERCASLPSHALSFEPCQAVYRLACNGDYAESVSRIVRQHIVIVDRDCKSAHAQDLDTARLTRRRVTDIWHNLRGALDIDLHAVGFEPLHDNTHPPKGGDKVVCPNDTQLEKMRVLVPSTLP
jgi:hypothetical protein